jgi:hypothetical protein
MNVLFGRLSPCPYDEGEQDGDDGFLVHIHFDLFVIVEYFN